MDGNLQRGSLTSTISICAVLLLGACSSTRTGARLDQSQASVAPRAGDIGSETGSTPVPLSGPTHLVAAADSTIGEASTLLAARTNSMSRLALRRCQAPPHSPQAGS